MPPDLTLGDILSAYGGGVPDPENPSSGQITPAVVLAALGGSSWLARAQEAARRDAEAYQRGGVPELMANRQETADLAGGFGGTTKNVGIRAYHGSPYDFEKFDLSRIGTGEGAQAYGHGLYFAENPAVAEAYKKNLSGKGTESIQYQNGKYHLFDQGEYVGTYPTLEEAKAAKQPGKMYEVNINARPEQFLDWEKPISEQPTSVRQVYQKVTGSADPAEAAAKVKELQTRMDALASERDPVTNQMLGEPEWFRLANQRDKLWEQWNAAQSGSKTYQALSSASAMRQSPLWADISPNRNRYAAASELLQREGIPGIRYLDQGSRGGPPTATIWDPKTQTWSLGETQPGFKQTSNYVVFNPEIVDILRKYGLAGLTMGGVLQAASQPEQRQ